MNDEKKWWTPWTDTELRIMYGLGLMLDGGWLKASNPNQFGPSRGMLDMPDYVKLATGPTPWNLLRDARTELEREYGL
jgi:hypothetical protein